MFANILRELKSYYVEKLFTHIHRMKRSYLCGILLTFIRFLIHVELILSAQVLEKIASVDWQLYQIFNAMTISSVTIPIGFLYLLLAWNVIFVLCLFADFLLTSLGVFQLSVTIIQIYMSLTARIFQHLLFIPSLFVSLNLYDSNKPAAIVNIILTPIIGVFLSIHDQNYSFKPKDSLAKRTSILDETIIVLLEFACVIARCEISNPKSMLIVPLVASVMFVFFACKKTAYEISSMRLFNLALWLLLLLIIAVIFCSMFATTTQSFQIVILAAAMFAFKLAKWKVDRQNDLSKYAHGGGGDISVLQEYSSDEFDFYLRLLLKNIHVDFAAYSANPSSILLELFVAEHCETCSEYPNCFCSQQPVDVESYEQLRIRSNIRHRFLMKHVRNLFYKHIREQFKKYRRVDVDVCLSYLSFLVEVYENKVLSFSETIRLKGMLNLSLKQQALFFSTFQKASSIFIKKELASKLDEKKKSKWDKINQVNSNSNNTQNPSNQNRLRKESSAAIVEGVSSGNGNAEISYNEDLNTVNYFLGIQFDSKVNQAERNFFDALQQKLTVLLILFADHIDLGFLRKRGTQLMDVREHLLDDLMYLFKINSNSQKLSFYTESFSQFFGFGQNRRRIFNRLKAKQFQSTLQIDSSIFNRNTCVVFVTLIGDVGMIKHAQNKFENLFGYELSQVIRKNISMILPMNLRKPHEEVLLDFLKNPEDSQRNQFSLVIAQDHLGWAVPISLKFRPDNIRLEDCGLTGMLEKPINEYNYIQTTSGTFQVEVVSQNLYDSILGEFFSKQELSKLYFNRVIPLLGYFETNCGHTSQTKNYNNNNNVFNSNESNASGGMVVQNTNLNDSEILTISTIAFLPKAEIFKKGIKRFHFAEQMPHRLLADYVKKKLSIEFYDLYNVKMRLYWNRLKKVNFNILEIHSFKKIHSFESQKDALLTFKGQLKSLLNMTFDVSHDFEILDAFIELNEIHKQLQPYQEEIMQHYNTSSDSVISEEGNNHQLQLFQQDEQLAQHDHSIFQNAHRDLSFKDELPVATIGIQNDPDLSKYQLLNGNTSILNGTGAALAKQQQQHSLLQFNVNTTTHIINHNNITNTFNQGNEIIGESSQFFQHSKNYPNNNNNNNSKFHEISQDIGGLAGAEDRYAELNNHDRSQVSFFAQHEPKQFQFPSSQQQSNYQLYSPSHIDALNNNYNQSAGLISPNSNNQTYQDIGFLNSPTNSQMHLFSNRTITNNPNFISPRSDQLLGLQSPTSQQMFTGLNSPHFIDQAHLLQSPKIEKQSSQFLFDSHQPKSLTKLTSTKKKQKNKQQDKQKQDYNNNYKNNQSKIEKNRNPFEVQNLLLEFYDQQKQQQMISQQQLQLSKQSRSQSAYFKSLNPKVPLFPQQSKQQQPQILLGSGDNKKQVDSQEIATTNALLQKDFSSGGGDPTHTIVSEQDSGNGGAAIMPPLKFSQMLKERIKQAKVLLNASEAAKNNNNNQKHQNDMNPLNPSIMLSQSQLIPQPQQHPFLLQEKPQNQQFYHQQSSTSVILAQPQPQRDILSSRQISENPNQPKKGSNLTNQLLKLESKVSTTVDPNINSLTKITSNQTRPSNPKRNSVKNQHIFRQTNVLISSPQCFSSENSFSNSNENNNNNNMQKDYSHQQSRSRVLGAASSLRTSQTQNQEHQNSIIRQVNSRRRNLSLFCLIVFGVIALLSISALVLVQYFQNVDSFDIAQLNFKYLPWALSQRFLYSRIFNYQMTRGFIGQPYVASLTADYLTLVNEQFARDIEVFKTNTLSFFYSDLQDMTFFQYTQQAKLGYTLSIDSILLPDKTQNITSNKRKYQISLQYFMLRLIPLFQRTYRVGKIDQQITLQDNFINFINTVNSILSLVQQSVLDIISEIQSQSLQIMIIVIASVFVLGLSIIPLNVHIQIKNEELLKLFATISSQALNNMYQPIHYVMSSQKISANNGNNNNNNKQNMTSAIAAAVNAAKQGGAVLPVASKSMQKRKTISSTSTLPKVRGVYFLYISFGIIFMIVQPIVSFIYISNFYNEADVLSDIMTTLYTTKTFCASLQATNAGQIQYQLGTVEMYNPIYYTTRITSLNKSKTATLAKIYASVEKAQATQRFEQELYDAFFLKIATGNICEAIRDHPSYITEQLVFNVTACLQVRSGLLTKGFQIAVNDIANTFGSLEAIYAITDQNEFRKSFSRWEASLNLRDFYDFFDLLTTSIEVMKNFLQERISSFITQMKTIFLGLLVYQLVMMTLIFYFAYSKFYLLVEEEMFATKQLFNILSIESVIENPYIISYLSRQD